MKSLITYILGIASGLLLILLMSNKPPKDKNYYPEPYYNEISVKEITYKGQAYIIFQTQGENPISAIKK